MSPGRAKARYRQLEAGGTLIGVDGWTGQGNPRLGSTRPFHLYRDYVHAVVLLVTNRGREVMQQAE